MRYIALITMILLFASCGKDGANKNSGNGDIYTPDAFMTKSAIGIYKGDVAIKTLDKATDQIAVMTNKIHTTFRMQKPNSTFALTTSHTIIVGSNITISTINSGIDTPPTKVKVVKRENNLYWLWDKDTNYGFIIYYEAP